MTDLSAESALEELKPREPIFHRRSYGTSLEALEAMTDEAFWEVGASGRVYRREFSNLLERYKSPEPHDWPCSDFSIQKLAPNLAGTLPPAPDRARGGFPDFAALLAPVLPADFFRELLSELIASSKEFQQFRTALPPGFARREEMKKTLKEGLAAGTHRLIGNYDSDRLIDDFLQRIRLALVRQGGTFQSDSRVIELQTKLKTPDPRHYRLSTEERGTILEFAGRKFVFPDKIRVTIDEMCAKKSFSPGELAGPLDNSGKLNFVRYLHGERFLTFVD